MSYSTSCSWIAGFAGALVTSILPLPLCPAAAIGHCAALVVKSAQSSEETAAHPVTLTVQVDVQPRGTEVLRPVLPGETLYTGDRIGLRVEVDRAAYVKVLQVFPSGQSVVLFPRAGVSPEDTRIEPGSQRALPFASRMFELDEDRGPENLVVVATERPLAEVAPRLERLFVAEKSIWVRTSRGVATLSSPAGNDRPVASVTRELSLSSLGTVERSARLPVPGKPHLLRVRSDRSGVALLRFSFTHESSARMKTAPPTL